MSRFFKELFASGVPVDLGVRRRTRSGRQVQVDQAELLRRDVEQAARLEQARLERKARREEREQKAPEEKYYEEDLDQGDIDLGREELNPAELVYQENVQQLRALAARRNDFDFVDVFLNQPDINLHGLTEEQGGEILDLVLKDYPEFQNLINEATQLVNQRELDRQRERQEDMANQRFQRRRAPFARLEQTVGIMPRHNWLDAAVRVVNTNPYDPELVTDLVGFKAQIPAIEYAQKLDEYDGPYPKVEPRIADWKRCQRCAWWTDEGQCKRYASCHRPYPSNTYCWEHAKEGLPELNPYTRRLGLA